MSLRHSHRLLPYVSLALAGLCLFVAEHPFLPYLWLGMPVYLGLLGLAWYLEDRWRLPLWGSNSLGILIALGTVWWLVGRLPDNEGWAQDVPVTARLVPYLGPVTMALLLVRLLGTGRSSDFWLIQGMGLLQVALGCVLATGPLFGVLLLAYLVSGLALLRRQQIRRSQEEGGSGTGRAVLPLSSRILGLFLWSLAVGWVALPFYLLTPRNEEQEWDPFRRFGVSKNPAIVAQTGHSSEIDINRTGVLEPDDQVAFTVLATRSDDQPRTDLPGDQRWRGEVLENYESGRWLGSFRVPRPGLHPQAPASPVQEPPDAMHLIFTIQLQRAGGLFLADPVLPGTPPGGLPVHLLDPRDATLWFSDLTGTLNVFPRRDRRDRREYRYRQAVGPSWNRERYPALGPGRPREEQLVSERVPGLATWTRNLLRRLIEQKGWAGAWQLPPDSADEVPPRLPEVRWKAAAQLLTDHLAHSGEYSYTLNLRRQDATIDPVMDFLVNLKEGHCERYATALTLMLRSQGIPARLVKGFRGAEHQGQGVYFVRQLHAHAWVEALIPRADPREEVYDWLVLDPTPDRDALEGPGFSLARLWQQGQRSGRDLWRELVVEFNTNTQAGVWSLLRDLGERWTLWLGLGGTSLALAGVLAFLERWNRNRHRKVTRVAPPRGLLGRLRALLERPGRVPREVGQTAQEWAEKAQTWLGERLGRGGTNGQSALPAALWPRLLTVPGRVVALFYRERYGGHKPAPDEERELAATVEELARALA
jgi:transglutaminase-like putative cysteine protease